jgi:hypothetical protein
VSPTLMPESPNRAEIARRVEKAEKLLQKGKTPDALAEYLQILEADPQNDNVRQMAADLSLTLNKGAQAVRLLGELFDRQVSAGEATRASLTYKKLARYANPTWEQKVRFGTIQQEAGGWNLRKRDRGFATAGPKGRGAASPAPHRRAGADASESPANGRSVRGPW